MSFGAYTDEVPYRVSDVDLWDFVDMPTLPTTTYADIDTNFYFTMYAGMYCVELEIIQ